jgi:hypothetical protein
LAVVAFFCAWRMHAASAFTVKEMPEKAGTVSSVTANVVP